MNETRNLLRYLIPAGIFQFQVVLLLLIADWQLFRRINEYLIGQDPKVIAAIGAIALFAQPMLGHFIGLMHHSFYDQYSLLRSYPRISHERFVQDHNNLVFFNLPEGMREDARTNSWIAVNYLWYSKMDIHGSERGIEERNNLFSHITHSAGTNYVGSFAALALVIGIILVHCFTAPSIPHWHATFPLSLGIWCLLMRFHRKLYIRALDKQRYFVETALLIQLRKREKRLFRW